MLTFEQWCELNGKRWTECRNFEEFRRNADDYQAYRDLESDAAIARATPDVRIARIAGRRDYDSGRSDVAGFHIPLHGTGDTGTD